MDSPIILDSSSESQYDIKKEKTEVNSLYSTDDELSLNATPQCGLLSKNLCIKEEKSCTPSVVQFPRTIMGFLERKIELNNTMRAQNQKLLNQNNNNKSTLFVNNIDNAEQMILSKKIMKEEDKKKNCQTQTSYKLAFKGIEILTEDDCIESEEVTQQQIKQDQNQKSGQKKFVVYQIEAVQENKNGNRVVDRHSWTFSSRYSMLRGFYKGLKKEVNNFSKLQLPNFPGKKWFGNMDSKFLTKRMMKLQAFFDALCQKKVVVESAIFQEFLSESRDAADEEFSL